MILAYYLSITAYCTPYNALIPELGHTQQERLNISTVISFTFIAGTAVAVSYTHLDVYKRQALRSHGEDGHIRNA